MFANKKKEKSKQFIILPYESERTIVDNRVENKHPKELIMDDIYKFLDYVYEMEMVVENIRNYLPDDDYLRVSVSTGLASVTSPVGETLEGLLLKADEALYLAKEGGRNLVTLYEPPT